MPNTSDEKKALRARAMAIRSMLDMPSLSRSLCQRLASLPEYQAAENVLIYLAMPGEVTVEEMVAPSAGEVKRYYVPRCAPKRRLAIHPYVPGQTPLRSGPFGIREPDPAQVPEIDTGALNLVIVPGLLFSSTGDRLGYGGGYYDRFLPHLPDGCLLIGAMPEALVLPSLPRDPWDVPLDIIVTEQHTFDMR